jgi:ATP-dependent exoDNAse (exonuclease V) beta subunit
MAVNILTVHKAKGLEFQAVIIPFLEMDVKVGSGGRDGSQAYVLDIQEEGMGLVRLKESYRTFCPDLQAQYEAEYKKAFLLELNTIYVALTRAVEELHIFIPERSGININYARFLIPEECFGIGTPTKIAQSRLPIEPHQTITSFIDQEWLPQLKEEFLSQEAVSVKAARQGEVDHDLLSRLTNLSEVPVDESIFKEEAGKRIKAVVESGALKKFFYLPVGTQVYCEKEFVNIFGDSKRIDRLIVHPDVVWVIDYKTSRLGQELHRKQILEYMNLVNTFYPKHKVEGFIIYLDDLSVDSL